MYLFMKRICCIIVLFFFFSYFGSYGSNQTGLLSQNSVRKEMIASALFNKPLHNHPRLLFSIQEEKKIKQQKNEEPLLDDLLGVLKISADKLLSAPLVKYELRAKHSDVLMISREHLYRMITLSLAYRMFGDISYAKKAEENLINVCNYPDWNPKHFLDVAEMTEAVAIGYDWLYHVISEDTKNLIQKSIKEKALNYAVREYAVGGSGSWAKRETNWNVVCNTGMIMGSLAIAESDPELAEKIISQAVSFIPNSLKYYAPDGVWFEGPGYWDYTSSNLAMLLKSLNDNLGHDYGFSDLPGISKTALYYVASTSPSGRIFNFADASFTFATNSPVYFYFSRRFNCPQVAEFYRGHLSQIVKSQKHFPKGHFFLCIPWYDNASAPVTEKPRLQIFENKFNPILVFNGKSTSKNSIYLIAKGGAGNVAHQHLDIGSYIIETNGVRWLEDLGTAADDYALPEFWDYAPVTGQRWKYFRYNNFSHNTLSIDNHLQYSDGRGKILRYDKESAQPFGIIDMTTVYKNLASKVYRGFKLLSDDLALIQDEISLVQGAKKIEWSSITSASITIDGNRTILQKDGKKLYIRIITPVNATFFTENAKSSTANESPVSGYTLIKATLSPADGTHQTLLVIMSSDSDAINDTNLIKSLQPLSNWN